MSYFLFSPRLISRGPIEACPWKSMPQRLQPSPRLISRGPIEADLRPMACIPYRALSTADQPWPH